MSRWLRASGLIAVLVLAACRYRARPVEGGGTAGGGGATPPGLPAVVSPSPPIIAEGDLRMSGSAVVDASGTISITLAAIRHPELPNTPVSPLFAQVSVSATASGSIALQCSITGVSLMQRAPIDLVFVNDTTASMEKAVVGISESVRKFAEDVSGAGVDAQFSMFTFGDAFSTKRTGSALTVGQADWSVPGFDNVERPFVDLSTLAPFESFLTELRGSGSLGVGGNDEPENVLGALQYANRRVRFRQGAARMFVAITDNPSHQAGDGTSYAQWAPPLGDELAAAIRGSAVVHVVANDKAFGSYYPMRRMANETGGSFMTLPADGRVDLRALGLEAWLTNSFVGRCTGGVKGSIDLVVRASVLGTHTFSGSLTFKLVMS